jgi:small conductance mechanosensitive channel
MDFSAMLETARPVLIAFGLKLIGAIVAYIVGRILIGFASNLVQHALERQKVEPTVIRYIGSVLAVALNIILVVAILGYFGVETTSFAALVAGLGIAVGAAWGGLLSNFAGGAFILVLRPFKVGDYVVAGDVEGTVRLIGLFNTTIDSPDNVQTLVGNAKIMTGTIKNFSHNPYRRVELTAQLDHSVDPADAVRRLKEALRPMSRSSPSTSAGRCWPCAPTATLRTTGRSISTATGRYARRSARPATRRPRRIITCDKSLPDIVSSMASAGSRSDPRASK